MNTFVRGIALILLVLPVWAIAQTAQDVSRVSGSIYPTVIRPAPLMTPKPQTAVHPLVVAPGAQGITAVCLTSQDNAAQCQASMDAAFSQHAGCNDNAAYDAGQSAMNEPSMYCHGRYEPVFSQSSHVAFCDVEDLGLSRCLSRYVNALVKQPKAAARALSFVVRDQGVSSTVIVLTTATQSEAEIAKAALEGKPGGSIVAMRMLAGNPSPAPPL